MIRQKLQRRFDIDLGVRIPIQVASDFTIVGNTCVENAIIIVVICIVIIMLFDVEPEYLRVGEFQIAIGACVLVLDLDVVLYMHPVVHFGLMLVIQHHIAVKTFCRAFGVLDTRLIQSYERIVYRGMLGIFVPHEGLGILERLATQVAMVALQRHV